MKKECSLIISLVALTLSIVAIFGIHKNIVGHPDLVLTLLGVCATIIVGISVISALELLQVTRKLKEIDQIKKDIEIANQRMDETKQDMDVMRNHANLALHLSFGLALMEWRPAVTISECLKGFYIALRENDASRAHTCLDILEKVLGRFQNDEIIHNNLKKSYTDKIPKKLPDEYRKLELYKVFEKRLESVFKEIEILLGS